MSVSKTLPCAALAVSLLFVAGSFDGQVDRGGPVAVIDTSGGLVAAWIDEGDWGAGVFVRRYDAQGNPLGPKRRADTGASSGGPFRVSLAPLAGGGFAVAWNGQAAGGSVPGLYLRRFDAEGRPLEKALLASAPKAAGEYGAIHPLSGGGFAAVWMTPGTGKGKRLFLRRYSAAGVRRGPVIPLRTFGTAETFHAVTAGPGDSLLVSWQIVPGTPCAWRAQRFGLDGKLLGASFGICTFTADTSRGTLYAAPSIAAGPDGYVAVWEAGNDSGEGLPAGIFGRHFSQTGVPRGSLFRIDYPSDLSGPIECFGPKATVGESGAFAVVWLADDCGDCYPWTGTEVVGSLYEPAGRLRTNEIQLGSNPPWPCTPGVSSMSVSPARGDHIAVVWSYLCHDVYDPEKPPRRGLSVRSLSVAPVPSPPSPGTITFKSHSRFGVDEQDGLAILGVQRSRGSAGMVSVLFETEPGTALAQEDYIPSSGILTWADGDVADKEIRIPVVTDSLEEGPESFRVRLRALSGGVSVSSPATVSIDSPGYLSLLVEPYSRSVVPEDVGTVTMTVERYGGRRGEVTVGYGWTDVGNGDAPIYGRLLWPDGDLSTRSFAVPIHDDLFAQGWWWGGWVVYLRDPSGGARIEPSFDHYLAIDDDELGPEPGVFRLSASATEVQEGAGSAEVRVQRTGGLGRMVSVRYATRPGTAASGKDFTPVSGILTWGDSDITARTIRVPVRNDTEREGDETFDLVLSNPRGGARLGEPVTLRLTIRDDDR